MCGTITVDPPSAVSFDSLPVLPGLLFVSARRLQYRMEELHTATCYEENTGAHNKGTVSGYSQSSLPGMPKHGRHLTQVDVRAFFSHAVTYLSW